jgi:hypothetical protein
MATAIEYAILSTPTYSRTKNNVVNLPERRGLVKASSTVSSGFAGSAYKKGTEIVIDCIGIS